MRKPKAAPALTARAAKVAPTSSAQAKLQGRAVRGQKGKSPPWPGPTRAHACAPVARRAGRPGGEAVPSRARGANRRGAALRWGEKWGRKVGVVRLTRRSTGQ
jgi:hypothetical protein